MKAAIALIAVWCFLAIPTLFAQEQRKLGPVVEMNGSANPADHRSPEQRKQRNKKHDQGAGRPLPEPSQPEAFDGGIADPPVPALPVSGSDTIVIGTVKSATAYLSDAKDDVYSEFRVAVESVVKTTDGSGVSIGQLIDVERHGGSIRFPSGRMLHVRDFHEGFPEAAKRYLFFLKALPETTDFLVLTAYEFRDGKVEPLDATDDHDGQSRFTEYKRYTEEQFVDVVRRAINAHP